MSLSSTYKVVEATSRLEVRLRYLGIMGFKLGIEYRPGCLHLYDISPSICLISRDIRDVYEPLKGFLAAIIVEQCMDRLDIVKYCRLLLI